MKKKLFIISLLVALSASAITIYWYHQAPETLTLQDNDIFLIERQSASTNLFTRWSTIKANLAPLIPATAAFPFVAIYPNGTFVAGGVTNYPVGSTTCGIQEAIHYLLQTNGPMRAPGGTIFFGPGTFWTSSTILIPGPDWGTNVVSINFEGSGKMASGITYSNSATNEVIYIAPSTNGIPAHVDTVNICFRNMFFSSEINACTNIIRIRGDLGGAAYPVGSIESAIIDRCWFFPGDVSTTRWYGNPSITNDSLIGINIDCCFNDQITIRDSTFTDLDCGIAFAADWGAIINNAFEGPSPKPSNWPTSSPFYTGAQIVFQTTSIGTYNDNQWFIAGNEFVHAPLSYLNVLPTTTPHFTLAASIYVLNDSSEFDSHPDGGPIVPGPIAGTTGGSICFVNPKPYYAASTNESPSENFFPGYLFTNTADFSKLTTLTNPSRLIQIIEPMSHPATSIPATNYPTAGQSLSYDGTNLYWH